MLKTRIILSQFEIFADTIYLCDITPNIYQPPHTPIPLKDETRDGLAEGNTKVGKKKREPEWRQEKLENDPEQSQNECP